MPKKQAVQPGRMCRYLVTLDTQLRCLQGLVTLNLNTIRLRVTIFLRRTELLRHRPYSQDFRFMSSRTDACASDYQLRRRVA
jgi:hypothetical protein